MMEDTPHAAATDNPASQGQLLQLKTLLDVPRDLRRPMTREESESFVHCSLVDTKGGKDQPIEDVAAEFSDAPLALAILLKRIRVAAPATPVRTATVLFLTSLCDSPGTVVLWAFYLVKRGAELGRAVRIADLAMDDFPDGFPTRDGYTAIWDEQKGIRHGRSVDNLLDTREAWSCAASEFAGARS